MGPLTEGSHTFELRATDEAGNTGSTVSHTWTVDLTGPVTTIGTSPPDLDNNPSPTFTFSGTDNLSPPSALTFGCQLDGGGFASCTSPQTVGPLTEGSHTFEVRATDEAGNTGSTVSHTWTVDLTVVEANPSFDLHQDPADGATGFKANITKVFDPNTGNDVVALLSNFRSQLTYDGTCVNILGVLAMDFPIVASSIANNSGVTTFDGSDATGVPWPSDLGHSLTRLIGSASQPCSVQIAITDLTDDGGNPIGVVPTNLTQNLRRGDARADGVINIADALFIAQYLVGLRPACTNVVDTTCLHSVNAASVRHDGAFDRNTIADALFIAQYLVGLRDGFYNLVP